MYERRPGGPRRGPTSSHEAGYLCVGWPKEYGGRGLTGVEVAVHERGVRPGRRAPRDAGDGRVARRPVDHRVRHRRAEGALPARASSTAPTATARASPSPTPARDLAGLKTRGVVDGDEVVITGQKVWTSGAQMANMMFCLCRTDPDAPKHRGISLRAHADAAATTARRTGSSCDRSGRSPARSGFTETFITEARAPLFNVIGGLHNGWRVTMTTLGNERGGNATTQHVQYTKQFWDAGRARCASSAATTTRSCASSWRGRTPTSRSCASRACARCREVVARKEPGPAASINKMFWSEYARDLGEWVMDLRGAESMIRPRASPSELRARPLAARVPVEPVGDDLGRHRPGAAQHRRRARARPPQGDDSGADRRRS